MINELLRNWRNTMIDFGYGYYGGYPVIREQALKATLLAFEFYDFPKPQRHDCSSHGLTFYYTSGLLSLHISYDARIELSANYVPISSYYARECDYKKLAEFVRRCVHGDTKC